MNYKMIKWTPNKLKTSTEGKKGVLKNKNRGY
jgi:hypothetical protein